MKRFELFRYQIRRQSGIYGLILFLLFILCYFSTKQQVKLYSSDYSIGTTDVLHYLFQRPYLSMIISPMFGIIALGLGVREGDDCYITRFRSRKEYWTRTVQHLMAHSFLFSIFVILVSILASLFVIPFQNFWLSDTGFIYYNVKNTLLENVWIHESWRFASFLSVFMYIVMGWVTYLATGIALHVLYMLFNSKAIAFALLMIVAICDTYLSFVPLLYRYSFMYLTYWFDTTAFLISISYLCIFCVCLYLIGAYFMNSRDYIVLSNRNTADK